MGVMGGRMSDGQAACHTMACLPVSYGLLFQSETRRARHMEEDLPDVSPTLSCLPEYKGKQCGTASVPEESL